MLKPLVITYMYRNSIAQLNIPKLVISRGLMLHNKPQSLFGHHRWITQTLRTYINVLRMDAPISVWWYFDNTLISASDKTKAIAKYEELYISNAPEDGCSYNFSSFGILSLSSNKSDAKVYVGVGNGPLCGLQTTLLLHRQLFGKWKIIGTEGFARS